MMKEQQTAIMKHLPEMEIIDSDLMNKVLALTQKYDYTRFTGKDVENALAAAVLTIADFAAVLSPAAFSYLEPMAQKAKHETRKHFGNSVSMFTPLYIANYCENNCVYCGFNCRNKIQRVRLSVDEIEEELKTIAGTGLKEILILTGESRNMSSVIYIGKAIELAKKYFSTIGIEIYPLNTEEYRYLQECGADLLCLSGNL